MSSQGVSRGWIISSGAVVVLALALTTLLAARFLDDPAALFDGLAHDRNHQMRGAQRLAVDLRNGDVLGWLRDFERFRLWPPLHGVVGSFGLAASGLDFRAAVFPSLLGFALTLFFGFACAARATGSLAAGLFAFVWIAASPAHHRFAGEVMLESLGAGLSLACLYFFLRVLEEPRGRSARWLGLALSLLFLEKYNYYAIVLLGLAAAVLLTKHPKPPPLPWRRIAAELRHPLVLLGLGLSAGALVVAFTGGTRFEVAGQRISMQRPFLLVWLGYASIFARLAFVTARERGLSNLSPPWRTLALWHAVPVAVWFALPRRLGYFLHHLSPANSPVDTGVAEQLPTYAQAFVANYHAGVFGGAAGAPVNADWTGIAGATVAIGLALFASGRWRSLSPGERAPLVFVGVAMLLTALHPNTQIRYLHSWIAGFWIVAAVGAHRWWLSSPRASAVLLTLATTLYGIGAIRSQAVPAGAPRAPSVLTMTDAWLAQTGTEESLAVVANMPAEELIEWRFVSAGGSRARLDVYTPRRRPTPEAREAHFREWLQETPAEALVFIDVADSSPWYAPRFEIYRELEGFVERQTDFERTFSAPAGPGTSWERWQRSQQ